MPLTFHKHADRFAALLILFMRWRDVPLFQPMAPYPEGGFLGLGRFLPSFGRDPGPGGSALWFWIKTGLFFVIVAVLVETFLA